MRRCAFLFAFLLALAAPSRAQIGKQPIVHAGSPEDKALREIDETADPAKKLTLLGKFLADFGQTDAALLGYERYIAHYLGVKDYPKAFEYGEKALAADPENFGIGFTLLRGAEEKGDAAKALEYGERLAGMLQRYRAAPPPQGTEAAAWEERKNTTAESLKESVSYIHYALYRLGVGVQDPAARAALLERYVAAFPETPFANMAQVMVTDSYQQAQQQPKMVAFAQKVLAGQAGNFWMMVVLADYWAAPAQQKLDKAEEYARKALELIPQAAKPEPFNDEQWAQQKSLQQGLANSALGQVLVHKSRDAQAVDALKAASPLLKPYAFYYGRNLYFLGYVLARLKRIPEARAVLTEAVSVNSPYRSLAQDTLNKIGGPVAKAPAKKRR